MMNHLLKSSIIVLLTLFMQCDQLSAQSYKQQFNDLNSKNDPDGQLKILTLWEKESSNDPELFIAYFNYYFNLSRKDMITMGNDPKGENVIEIMDTDSTKTEPVSYLFENTLYDQDLANKGIGYIQQGIKKYPNRLDMRFGEIYVYGMLEDYKRFTEKIVETIHYGNTIHNDWKWSDGEVMEEPRDFMLSSIQDYQLQLYETQNDDLLVNMKQIAECVLTYYPEHVESLSNLSIVYSIQGENDKALEVLLKAEKLSPEDYIVLANIAAIYKKKGDIKKSITYYELMKKYGNDSAKEYADGQLEELRKK